LPRESKIWRACGPGGERGEGREEGRGGLSQRAPLPKPTGGVYVP
jgi:hypothetical protein